MKKLFCLILSITTMFSLLCNYKINTSAASNLRGVWVCTVKNLDFPSKTGLSQTQLKSELDAIVNTCVEKKLNAIFFQVRPNADALYKSNIFPWSTTLSGIQGVAPDNNFDPLEYIIEKSHANGIQLHAWINPYRIGTGGETAVKSTLCDTHPAVLHPEYTVTCSDGGVYFNPALQEVRDLITDGVKEIVQNYNVDGIHFDDYFYPYGVTDFPDLQDYASYGKDFATVEDFRRNNVNLLVKTVYNVVKQIKKDVEFGISPFGIWDNASQNPYGSETSGMSSYSQIYADSRAWVQNGWIDYICPQVYWSFENTKAPFETVVKWWDSLCSSANIKLYIGHANYKVGTDEEGWNDPDQISRQLQLTDTLSSVCGNVFFRYGTLDNKVKIQTVETPSVVSESVNIVSPSSNVTTYDSTYSIMGSANPNHTITVNGMEIPLTEHGYFSYYATLDFGKNVFIFKNGDSSKTVTITRTKKETADNIHNTFFEKDSAYPFDNASFSGGETITLSVRAKQDINVYARFLKTDYALTQTNVKDGMADYQCTVTLPHAFVNDINCGSLVFFTTDQSGKEYTYDAGTVTALCRPIELYTQSECYIYNDYTDGSMMDNYQLPQGTKVSATALVGERYRLVSSKWVDKENLDNVPPESVDIELDKEKYTQVTLTFNSTPTFVSRVTENGVLVLETYGAGKPKISMGELIDVSLIKNGCDYTLIFTKDTSVTGFYVSSKDNVVTVYILKTPSGIEGKTIVIDAGHGGDDKGALGPAGVDGVCENDLNLAVSQLLAARLSKKGVNVIMTRNDDLTLPLADRAPLSRSHTPDLFISIHHNSYPTSSDFSKASGTLILYSRNTALPLGNVIDKYLNINLGIDSKGVNSQSLNVCRDYRYPCILIECGYVCNPSEYEKLLTDDYKNTLCDNIVTALCQYFN